MSDKEELLTLVTQAKQLARRYYELTGRPLGVTGEIAEGEAVRLLNLKLAPVRTAGYDAVRPLPDGREQKLQVKGRVTNGKMTGQRMGRLDTTKEWDAVVLVLMDRDFNAVEIFEAPREALLDAIGKTKRGALPVPTFRRLGKKVWPVAS